MPTLNQTGELNAIFWWTIRWVSSALKVCEVVVRREVVLGLRPGGDRVDDAVDQLADGGLALRRAEVAAEVLADDDVGGELAPEVGDLDVLLLEDALAGLVGDAGGPVLPGDLVVGMDARAGPAALEGQAADGGRAVQLGAVEGRRRTGRRGGGERVLPQRPCPKRGPGCLGPSALSSVAPMRWLVVAAASFSSSGSSSDPGGRSRPASRAGVERVGRLGSIWRPQERYAAEGRESTQKHKM